jgi:Ca2+-binding EF-hand superfamily protein
LRHCPDYTPHAAYRAIDKYDEGKINQVILCDFFRKMGTYMTDTEIFAIIRRIDTDGDARISFAEFADFLGA